jgi:hypothetical protein
MVLAKALMRNGVNERGSAADSARQRVNELCPIILLRFCNVHRIDVEFQSRHSVRGPSRYPISASSREGDWYKGRLVLPLKPGPHRLERFVVRRGQLRMMS